MSKLFQNLKIKFNYWIDRIIDHCDMVLIDSYQVPRAIKSYVYAGARWVGEICHVIHDFPRLSVTEYSDCGWRIVFLGEPTNQAEITELCFGHPVEPRCNGRVSLWNLSRQCETWLNSGVDLIIIEQSKRSPWQPQAPLRFVVPAWVRMFVTLPTPLDDLLVGNKRKRVRQRVKKGREAGFQFRFSQMKSDFDDFHYQMYLPFIRARHGEHAAISTYKHQWERSFQRGGLVMVTQNEKSVGGALCYVSDDVCHSIEGGIRDADPELLKQELNGMIDWYSMLWAQQQGANLFDMGGTRARCSDGIFLYKRQWGAAPMNRNQKLFRPWTFLAGKRIPANLCQKLNEIQFISQVGDQFYGVHLHTDAAPLKDEALQQVRNDWSDEGLDGILVLSPHHAPITYPSLKIEG